MGCLSCIGAGKKKNNRDLAVHNIEGDEMAAKWIKNLQDSYLFGTC